MTDRDTITRTRARAPGVGGAFHRMAVQYIASTDPTLCGSMLKHEGRRQTDRRSAYAGSRLKLIDASGRSRLIRQPFSRNGENSPYGMLGGIVETSASFEARSAPRSYPTANNRPTELALNTTPNLSLISLPTMSRVHSANANFSCKGFFSVTVL